MGSIACERIGGVLGLGVLGVAGLARVSWSVDGLAGRSVRIYVDGVLWDVVCDGAVGEAWLMLDGAGARRVELASVAATEAFAGGADSTPLEVAGWSPGFETSAELAVIRDERLAVESEVRVSVDGVDDGGHRYWDAAESRGGFGGLFGAGGFGWDGGASVGLGLGEFGVYGFGFGGTAWRWRDDGLSEGDHVLGLRVEDGRGVELASLTEEAPASVEALPEAAAGLTVSEEMVLSWP
jgi:hypothetical protein